MLELQNANALLLPHLNATDTFYVSTFNYQCESERSAVVAYAVEAPLSGILLGDSAVSIGDTTSYFYQPSIGNNVQWFVVGGVALSATDSLLVKWDSTNTAKVGVIETNALGCSSDTLWLAVEVDLAIGIEKTEAIGLKISPNPASTQILIERINVAHAETIELCDSEGKFLLKANFVSRKRVLSLDVSKLATGLYYLRSSTTGSNYGKVSIVRE